MSDLDEKLKELEENWDEYFHFERDAKEFLAALRLAREQRDSYATYKPGYSLTQRLNEDDAALLAVLEGSRTSGGSEG